MSTPRHNEAQGRVNKKKGPRFPRSQPFFMNYLYEPIAKLTVCDNIATSKITG
jgi:hypothetical protein